MSYLSDHLEVLTWHEVKHLVQLVNPKLAMLIDDFNPDKSYKFIKVRYKFGQEIVKKGRLSLPITAKETIALSEAEIDQSIKRELSYNLMPIWMSINKKSEIFYESNMRVMPTKIVSPGYLAGLWEAFDPRSDSYTEDVWSVTAGARSLFMLPKISDQVANKRIKQTFKVSTHIPAHMLAQHAIFKDIVNAIDGNGNWYHDALFFGKKWSELENVKTIEAVNIRYYFLEQAWQQSYNCRNNMAYDLAKEIFTKAVTEKRIKPKPILLNTLKHLLSMAEGFYPGYAPAVNDIAAPVGIIRDVYVDYYKIQYDPTVLEPTHLCKAAQPVYYSLQLPSLLENAPSVQGKNIIIDLRELSMLMDILNNSLPMHKAKFSFYHSSADPSYKILPAEDIFQEDFNFRNQSKGASRVLPFAVNGPFLKGCVRVQLDEDRYLPIPI